MSRNRVRYKVLQMIDLISRSSGGVIPINDMKFSHVDTRTLEHVYRLLMPITKTWQEIRISDLSIKARVIPMHVCELVDQYLQTKKLMERARDLQVFNEDVRPISDTEKQIFGVRIGENNKCFPAWIVASIRFQYSTGVYNQYELADLFGISQQHISKIVRGERR